MSFATMGTSVASLWPELKTTGLGTGSPGLTNSITVMGSSACILKAALVKRHKVGANEGASQLSSRDIVPDRFAVKIYK